MGRMNHRAGLAVAAAGVLALALAGCGGGSGSGGSGASGKPKVSVDSALAGKVPAAVKADGKVLVATDATYAPDEFLDKDGKTVIGFEVDLFDAVAAKLGLKTQYVPSKFGDVVPGVQDGKYELGMSSLTINPDREKTVNMVSYYSAGIWWATKKGNPAKVQPDAACGKKIAVQKDTVEVDDITAKSKKCTDAGKPAITIDQYQGQDQATASVVSGKDDAELADSPVIAYALKQTGGQLETLGKIYQAAPYGYAIKKDQLAFAQAVQGAVQALIADGTYQKVLDKWNVGAGKIGRSEVNPTVSG